MKRILACFVTLMMVLGLSGCGQAFQMDKITDLKEIPFGASYEEMRAQADGIPFIEDVAYISVEETDESHSFNTNILCFLEGEFLGLPLALSYDFLEGIVIGVGFGYQSEDEDPEATFESFKEKLQKYGGESPEEYIYGEYDRELIWNTKDYYIKLALISSKESKCFIINGYVVNLNILHEIGTDVL